MTHPDLLGLLGGRDGGGGEGGGGLGGLLLLGRGQVHGLGLRLLDEHVGLLARDEDGVLAQAQRLEGAGGGSPGQAVGHLQAWGGKNKLVHCYTILQDSYTYSKAKRYHFKGTMKERRNQELFLMSGFPLKSHKLLSLTIQHGNQDSHSILPPVLASHTTAD